MKRFYQAEWHNIYFKDFGVSSSELPTKNFYDQFYEIFFNKYASFKDLDESWVNYKLQIADHINKVVKNKTNILSIGSGIGIVEDELTNLNSKYRIKSIEPSENASKWVKNNPHISIIDGYFPECLEKGLNFDLVYANNIDYVFDRDEYRSFLKSIIDYGVSDFLVVSSALYNLKVGFSLFFKEVLGSLGLIDRLTDGQFWGYLRSESEHKEALTEAGFNKVTITKLGKDTILLRAQI